VAEIDGVRFGHVNVTSADWRRLAQFYADVFGCTVVPPERNLRGPALEAGTGVPDAHLEGVHLRLPGLGEDGPTIEIYTYDALGEHPGPAVTRPGWGHLAFQVPDVERALAIVIDRGGGRVGDIVTTPTADGRAVTWCYATDPDGNIIELQRWTVR